MDVDELPHEPADLEDLHIPWSVLEDLVLRRAYLDGHSSTIELAETLCVSPMVMEQAIEELRHNQLIDVRGRERRNYFVAVTDLGHEQVNERLALSRYAGAVPVSLDDYTAMVRAQDHPALASHETVRRAFEGSPWEASLAALKNPRTLRAMVLRSDGGIVVIRGRSHSRDTIHVATMVARYLLATRPDWEPEGNPESDAAQAPEGAPIPVTLRA